MIKFLEKILDIINNFVEFIGDFGIIGAILASSIATFIPFIPLFPIAGANYANFGFLGLAYTYAGVILGNLALFSFVRFLIVPLLERSSKLKKSKIYLTIANWEEDKSFTKVVVLYALPFVPTFPIVLSCGLGNITIKEYLRVITFGSIGTVLFSTYIGVSLFHFLDNPENTLIALILCIPLIWLAKYFSKKKKLKNMK